MDEKDDYPKVPTSIFNILQMNQPEWPQIVIACIGSGVVGCAMPAFAVLFGSILSVSF